MTSDDQVERERKRQEAEYEEPGHELTKQTPGLDDETPEEPLGEGVLERGEDVITKGESRGPAFDPGRPAK
jgi:hypothetical protein